MPAKKYVDETFEGVDSHGPILRTRTNEILNQFFVARVLVGSVPPIGKVKHPCKTVLTGLVVLLGAGG